MKKRPAIWTIALIKKGLRPHLQNVACQLVEIWTIALIKKGLRQHQGDCIEFGYIWTIALIKKGLRLFVTPYVINP